MHQLAQPAVLVTTTPVSAILIIFTYLNLQKGGGSRKRTKRSLGRDVLLPFVEPSRFNGGCDLGVSGQISTGQIGLLLASLTCRLLLVSLPVMQDIAII